VPRSGASRRDVLLDTAPLAAVFNTRDQWHAESVGLWPELIERCVTTEAVITEATYLVLRATGNAHAPLDFLLAAAIPIIALDVAGHRRAAGLMERHRRLPMDYADASLVVVAEALLIDQVFTMDRRGFATYQSPRGKRFRLLPER
jgi:hypothetical protein